MEISEMDMDAALCYVSEGKAYFTTQLLKEQWGDDWDDAPYEHNAETPYESHNNEWKIFCVHFDADLREPCEGINNSPYSVEMINKKQTPWLRAPDYEDKKLEIYAGCPLSSFIDLIQEYGAEVHVKIDAVYTETEDKK